MKVWNRTEVAKVGGGGGRAGVGELGAVGTRTMDGDRNLERPLKGWKKWMLSNV